MARNATPRTTLKDVARAAQVSLSTVSYVLNNNEHAARISAPTRERVWAAAARLGYKSDPIGRALQRVLNQVILLIVAGSVVPPPRHGHQRAAIANSSTTVPCGG